MPILSCRILLLLVMVPFLAVAGRRLPAPPVTPSLTPTPQFELTRLELGFGSLGFWKHPGHHYQDWHPPPPNRKLNIIRSNVKERDSIFGHRLLVGSAPPSCQGKCGSCIPCTPIHTPIGSSPSGSLTQQEYYPEVWRCKCGNKLYLP